MATSTGGRSATVTADVRGSAAPDWIHAAKSAITDGDSGGPFGGISKSGSRRLIAVSSRLLRDHLAPQQALYPPLSGGLAWCRAQARPSLCLTQQSDTRSSAAPAQDGSSTQKKPCLLRQSDSKNLEPNKASVSFVKGCSIKAGCSVVFRCGSKRFGAMAKQPNIPPVVVSMQKFRKNKINAPRDSTPGALNQLPCAGTVP